MAAMTRRKTEIIRSDLEGKWPHHASHFRPKRRGPTNYPAAPNDDLLAHRLEAVPRNSSSLR
jgi:hypothetical protein